MPADPGGGPAGGHYFDPTPAVASRPSTVELVLPDLHLTLHTDRGVFGADSRSVDPGTKLLLLEAVLPTAIEDGAEGGAVDLLDLGCGYGPIAVILARRAPNATVWAVDVNERARALCEANAAAAGVGDRVRVVAPDEVPADVRFAAVWSNPPIRIGKPALHELLTTWLGRLATDGSAWLVVHKHLGSDSLARWLDSVGHPTARRASRSGYRILEVAAHQTRPPGADDPT